LNSESNIKVLLAARPKGYPRNEDFLVIESEIPKVKEGELLVKIDWLSLDPYMRGRMNDVKSYAPSVEVGEVMVGGAVGTIIESRTSLFSTGEIVEGSFGWQSYALSNGLGLRKINPELGPIQSSIGVLGMPGLTAYFGLLDVCQPIAGDTVVVSAASGAVGQIAGQIAKIMGCRVIGTAGTNEKVQFIVDELGFDVGINYKTENVGASLNSACTDGIDIYFDNVGGFVTDEVIKRINTGARIAICGQVSQYNLEEPELGPRNLFHLTKSQAKMEGFLVFAYEARYDEALHRLSKWINQDKLKYKEDIVEGIKNAPQTFIGMLNGENLGKTLIKVS
jgi:NADPH-dependent curcumin reductase CurA|tara:strand:- start:2127 stop:3134 length:1008 start_codon:yes stop_codon:yes gene_type:complete